MDIALVISLVGVVFVLTSTALIIQIMSIKNVLKKIATLKEAELKGKGIDVGASSG